MPEPNLQIITLSEFPIEILAKGYQVKIKLTGMSMFPFLKPGDQTVLSEPNSFLLKRGDLVAFVVNEQKVLHRIISVKPGGYVTKGDSCLFADGLIAREKIIAVATHLFKEGREVDLFEEKTRKNGFNRARFHLPLSVIGYFLKLFRKFVNRLHKN